MKAFSHVVASLGCALISLAVLWLGILEGSPFSGFVGFLVMMAIAWAFFNRAETLIVEESIGRRLYRGKFN